MCTSVVSVIMKIREGEWKGRKEGDEEGEGLQRWRKVVMGA